MAEPGDDVYRRSAAVLQKYCIKPDGTFVGDFDAIYRECEDPWVQRFETTRSPLKRLILWRIAQLPERRVIDLGCGNGHFTNLVRSEAKAEVLGLDVSSTAVANARAAYPLCRFEAASAIEIVRFAEFKPTAICMCSLTWYILDSFRDLLGALRQHFQGTLVFHTLTFYGREKQKYGREYFTSLEELLPFFSGMTVEETLIHEMHPTDGSCNTLVIARV